MTMSSAVGSLEEEALKRKERLKNLKRKIEDKSDAKSQDGEKKTEIPKPIFRNYRAEETPENLKNDIKITEITDVPGVKEQIEEMKTPLEITDIDISNLAPRKVDFDLKRAISKKLQKLELRTQRAISELIRERLQNKDDDNFANNVNVGAKIQEHNTESVDSD